MLETIGTLRNAVSQYRNDALSTKAFVALWQQNGGHLCAALPPAYAKAMDDLLMRTESSQLFSGDSCSFSRDSLMDAFAMWLDKASAKLA